ELADYRGGRDRDDRQNTEAEIAAPRRRCRGVRHDPISIISSRCSDDYKTLVTTQSIPPAHEGGSALPVRSRYSRSVVSWAKTPQRPKTPILLDDYVSKSAPDCNGTFIRWTNDLSNAPRP